MDIRRSEKAAPPPGDSAIEFVMSDDSVDRMGDVIEPKGWKLDNFAPDRNPIALFNHNPNFVIGRWRDVRVVKNRLLGRLELAEHGTSDVVNSVRSLVQQKMLRTVSVGFKPIKAEPLDENADEYGGPFRFLEQELLECSLVAVPANANAIATAKSMNLPADAVLEIFSKPANEDPTRRGVPSGKPAKHLAPHGVKMATRSQRIEAAQQSINQMRDRAESLDALETRTDPEQTELEDLTTKIEQTRGSLEQMMALERAISGDIGKTTPRAPAVLRHAPRRMPDKPGELVFKAATAIAVAKATNKPLAEVLQERYPGNDDIGIVLRTAMAPAMTTVAGWAAELSAVMLADYLNLLPRSAIFPTLSSKGPSFTFGSYGSIKIPARLSSPTINGSFVGEGQAIPVRKLGLSSITLTPKKMAVISEFTREMAQHSTPAIEGVVRQAIIDDTAQALDTALIDNVAADSIRPAGLLNGLTTQAASANTTPYLKIIEDITTLIAPIATARGGRDLVMIMNIAQYNKIAWAMSSLGEFVFDTGTGQVRNVSLVWSTTVPAGQVIMVDAADFASVTGTSAEFDVSEVATIHEEDTAPLPLVGGTVQPPAIGSVAAPVRSLWQTGSIGIRMIMPMNWVMRRTGMVTFIAAVTW